MNENFILTFKLEQFDGPLDLLVELIKEKKMDILSLDIADLTFQYLKFINENLTKYSIDDISEYLVMASYLIDLKSKMLIPILTQNNEISETELEIDRLRRQLFLYKQYKDVINEFKMRQSERTKLIPKLCDDLEEFIPENIPEAPLPDFVPIEKLVRAWQKVLINLQQNQVDKTFVIKVNNIDVDKIQENLIEFIGKNKNISNVPLADFIKLFDQANDNLEFQCAVFISLLVLARDGYILLKQDTANDTIYISTNNNKISNDNNLLNEFNEAIETHKKLALDLEKEFKTKEDIEAKLKELISEKNNYNKGDKNE